MKREFLKALDLGDGMKLSDAAIDTIMAEYGKKKNSFENTIAALSAERDGLQTQLEGANAEIQSYKDMDIDGIRRSAADWENKYNTDTQALKERLADKEYEFSVNGAVSGIKFTSESAKRAFMSDLTAKRLPVQDGRLLGLEDFVKAYQERDPGAFQPGDDDKTPIAVKGGTGGQSLMADAALRAAMGLPTKNE